MYIVTYRSDITADDILTAFKSSVDSILKISDTTAIFFSKLRIKPGTTFSISEPTESYLFFNYIISRNLKSQYLKPIPRKPKSFNSQAIGNCYFGLPELFKKVASGFSQHIHHIRAPLLAVHASPGLGKTAFLEELSSSLWKFQNDQCKYEDVVFSDAASPPLWLETAILVTATFNSTSPIL